MPNTSKVLILTISVLVQISCTNRFAEPVDVLNFCENVDIGSDFSAVLASLPSQALELREYSTRPDLKTINPLMHAESVESALITSEGLEGMDLNPACLVYFSSVLLNGDGKVVYKQFVGELNKGI
jgi:hypothetical protein